MDGENKIKYVHVQLAGKNPGKTEWLGLPADADRLGRAFSSLGIEKPEDLQIKEVACPYKGIGKYLSGAANLDALNTVAVFLSDMRDHELVLACAIAEMDLSQFGENTLDVLLNVYGDDDNLNGFEVIDAFNEIDVGRYWANEEHAELASEAEYAAYGRENMEDGGVFTEWGYVRCVFQPQMLYDSDRLPESCQVVAAALQSAAQETGREYPAVYPFSADVARQNGELDLYRESNRLHRSCAQAIDAAIHDSNYKLFHYDLTAAARSVISEYGAGRVQWVLAHTVQSKEWDGRFSYDNKEWAKGFDIPEIKFSGYAAEAHPAILDGFINQVRKILQEREKSSVLDSLKKGREAGARPKPEKPTKKSGPEL